ncbi:MAG: hypothetical protein LBJ63_11900 [Prevotellaceae bacterium]|jgi:lipopolysaccharide export system protein LptC|nr:hypothetical protein [Prevotellaceae bacterium]
MKPNRIKTMALALCVIVFFSCSDKQEEITDNTAKEDVLLSETLNLNVVLSQYGKTKQTAQAARMLQFSGKEGKYTTFPDGIYVESFTDSLVLESTIEAKFAKMKEGRDEFYSAYDSVVVTNYLDNTKIITDTLYWDRINGKIYNDCFTKFFLKNGFFDAHDGWISNENLSDYEIRTIREGDLTIDRQHKTANDSTASNAIIFPDTTEIIPQQQPKPAPTPTNTNQQLKLQDKNISNPKAPQPRILRKSAELQKISQEK